MNAKLFFVAILLTAFAQGAWAVDRNYEYPTKTKPGFHASYGGKSNVVVINTPEELAYVTAHFSEGSGYDGNKDWDELNYYLNADIDMGTSYSWLPLGRESYWVTKYSGKFWGNGHTITYKTWGLDEENQGLFSTIDQGGEVHDVKVECEIYSKRDYVGGIAGENYGLIENCTVTASITEDDNDYVGGIVGRNTGFGTVKGCTVSGTIQGLATATYLGGIAGKNEYDKGLGGTLYHGKITNCWVSADVTSECSSSIYAAYLGGIAGYNQGYIQYCCMTGDVTNTGSNSRVAGLVGYNNSDVKHCTFYGTVTVDSWQENKYVGIKHNEEALYDTFNETEYNAAIASGHDLYAYAIKTLFVVTVTTTGTGTVSVVDTDADVTDLTKVQIDHWIRVTVRSGVVLSCSVKDAANNDVNVYRYHQYGDNYFMFAMPRSDVSVTVNFTTQQGDGTEANPYRIANAADWEAFVKTVNEDGKSYEGEFVMLDGDFEVSTYQRVGTVAGFMNVFKGTFDGNGHTLTSIYAPFHQVMDATIKNLHVVGNATGYHSSGSIVDYSKGALKLINCRSSVNVNCIDQFYGGLVGIMSTSVYDAPSPNANSITIEGCVFDGSFYSTNAPEYKVTNCSGFVGDAKEGGNVVIRNSFLKPASVDEDILANTFAYMRNGSLTIENSYFVAADNLPTNQGKQAHSITAGDDVTLSGLGNATATYGSQGITAYAKGIKYGGVYYAGSGENVSLTLSHGSKAGYRFNRYVPTAGTLNGTTLTMPNDNVTINADWTQFTFAGAGTADDPFIIGNAGQWDEFVGHVNEGYTFSGQFLKLNANISVSTMAGADDAKSFQGSFDGGGHTLTFNVNTSAAWTAPFRHTKNATIKNLHVAGTITTSGQFAAGFVGESHGALTIRGCRSSVAINSSVSGDGTHGGFVSTLSGSGHTIIIDGCVFDGSFATTANTTNCGGFVGWPVWNRPVISNSLMKPGSVDAGMLNNTFARWHTTDNIPYKPTITGCYFVTTNNLPANQGNQAYSFASAPANLGSLKTEYDLVKVYENGLFFDGLYYMVATDISLTAATVFEESKFVATFYNGTQDYSLGENAKAYTMSLDGGNVIFHQIGDDGRVIPHGTAVVIVSSESGATLFGLNSTTVTPHDGNILQGTDTAISKPAGTVYVLGIVGESLGFYKFTGSTIPAGKAYYVVN